jgi:hypothetical protein
MLPFILACLLAGDCVLAPSVGGVDDQHESVWEQTFLSGLASELNQVESLREGGYIAAGTFVPSFLSTFFYLARVDEHGGAVWEEIYLPGRYSCNTLSAIARWGDGGYLLLGTSRVCDVNDTEAVLLKTNATGELQWSRTFREGPSCSRGSAMTSTPDGGALLALSHDGPRGPDIWLMKLDANARDEWELRSVEQAWDSAACVVARSRGGFLIVGTLRQAGGTNDLYALQIDGNGTVQWRESYGGRDDDVLWPPNAIEMVEGGYLVGTTSKSFGPRRGCYVVRIDDCGAVVWGRFLSCPDSEVFVTDIVETSDGGSLVVGFRLGHTLDFRYAESYLLRLDRSGFPLLQRMIGGGVGDVSLSIEPTADQGYVVAGYHKTDFGSADMTLRKLAPEVVPAGAFLRGDSNGDGHLDLSDAVRTLSWLFQASDPLDCHDAADVDDDGRIRLTDAISVLAFVYLGGPEPSPPFPDAGLDPTDDPLGCARGTGP